MTLTEAAASLGVTAATLRQQIANGKLRARKVGDAVWTVTPREVERYRRNHLGQVGRKLQLSPTDVKILEALEDGHTTYAQAMAWHLWGARTAGSSGHAMKAGQTMNGMVRRGLLRSRPGRWSITDSGIEALARHRQENR